MYEKRFHYISFAGCGGFKNSLQRGLKAATDFGFYSKGYDDMDIDHIFKQFHPHIFNGKRGCGYWSWKPYIIRERLNEIKYGEYLIYMDAGVEMVKDPKPLLGQIKSKGMLCFDMKWTIGQYTKGDVFYHMNPNHSYDYKDERMVVGGVIFMKKTEYLMRFIDKWLYWCFYKDIITDEPSKHPNLPEFQDSRHDQSILSILVYQNEIPRISDLSQYRYLNRHYWETDDEVYYFLHGNRT